MINIIRNGTFVVPPLVGVLVLAITSFALCMMVLASMDSRVRTSDALCKVGEVMPGSESIRVKLECEEGGTTTATSTNSATSVLEIVRSGSATVKCNVMHTGWARDCRIP